MKIVELRAENVKRLRAVEIRPDGTLQVVGGRNAQGKSSVLDAIWLALGGGKAARETSMPIREGEKRASVRLDLGDLVVTRTWSSAGSKLRVEAPDGAAYPSPQAMLDGLVGRLSFDPLAFTRLSAGAQREALLDLVELDVDLDELAARRAGLYEERAEVGRAGKAIGEVEVDESLPEVEESVSQIGQQLDEAMAANSKRGKIKDELERLETELDDILTQIENLTMDQDEIQAEIEYVKTKLEQAGPPVDVEALRRRLLDVERANQAIRDNNRARAMVAEKKRLREEYQDLSEKIRAIDEQKADALAKAAFPVEGLGFDEDGVTYQGVPFAQASSAEQIRVSLAMAMAANPSLRVLRIKDGSLLDSDAMEAIRSQVADGDFQLWVERVGNADEGAVIIEDGQVAS